MRSYLISRRPIQGWSKGLCCILLLIPLLINAQSRTELERKRKQHEQEIKLTRQLLQETQKKAKATLNQLEVLSRQINTRQNLILTISQEIELVDMRMTELTISIADLQNDLKKFKDQYAAILRAAYKQRNTYDKLMYILAAESFDQAIKRIKYLQQFSEYRQKQVNLILSTQKLLSENLEELRNIKIEKEMLLVEKEGEKTELEQDKKEESKVLASLQKKEKELRKQLLAKEAAARKLKKAIEDLIERELAAARKRAEEEARRLNPGKAPTKPIKTSELVMTPEAVQLANDFSRNKGTLPWPVEQGFISKSYGVHPHPTLKNITVNNTGVDITTNKDAKARAIFRGEVKMKFFVPGMGYAVIVSHGDYYSVYTNLDEVFVKTGDKVNTKQEVGTVMVNEVEEKTELHIEIYKGKSRLDPEEWLFKK